MRDKSKRKPTFATGQVTSQNGGVNDVNIGGANYDLKNIPANSFYSAKEEVLICFVNDDTPIILGKPGYMISRGE